MWMRWNIRVDVTVCGWKLTCRGDRLQRPAGDVDSRQ